MNWTENSIRNNREISVIIDSKEVSDMYADLFLKDWGIEFTGNLEIIVSVPDVEYGETIELDASCSVVPQGCTFEWDLDGDGDVERRGETASWRFYGETECTLIVTDPDGEVYTHSFTVSASGEEKSGAPALLSGPLKYVPLILLCAILILMKRLKVSRSR